MPKQPPEPSPHRHGVFRSDEDGWTRSGLARASQAGRIHRVRRGFYVASDQWRPEDLSPAAVRNRLSINSVAAVLAIEGAVASHRSAAVLVPMPLWSWRSATPCLTVAPDHRSLASGSHLHRATLFEDHVIGAEVARTSASRTVLDLAREHGIVDAVVAGDFALHTGLTTPAELAAVAADCGRFPGIRRARTMINLLDARAESPLESVSRLTLRRLRLPAPELQVDVFDDRGHIGRADFYWDDWGIAGEADGREKYTDESVLWAEKRREDRLREAGLIVVRWTLADVLTAGAIESKLRAAIRQAALRPAGARLWRASQAALRPRAA